MRSKARPRTQHPPGPPVRTWIGLQGAKSAYDGLAAAFADFGHFMATHQTATLLLTGLVICSLLSPAIFLTFSPSGSPLDISASAITRRGRGELVWELEGMRRQGLISTEEEVCWDRVKSYYEKTGREGGGRRARVEQVLVAVAGPRGLAGSRGTIGKGVLHRAWRVQKELERRLASGEVPGNRCFAVRAGQCAVLSPGGWWSSEEGLLQDEDVHRTLSAPPPSVRHDNGPFSLPLTLSETFVGLGRDRQGIPKTAQYLVLTFFLEDELSPASLADIDFRTSNVSRLEDTARETAKTAWRRAVHDVVDHKGWPSGSPEEKRDPLGLTSEIKMPERHVLLKYLPHLTVDAHPRGLENLIYSIGYILVTLYVSRYIRKLRAHSKMGLLVTGFVELCASGIMSVSICWLLGWSLGLVPWNLLAFLVLTSGLDNMILVLRAIANTDMNLPVPQRMSQGLKAVGVEMTVLLLVEEFMAGALLSFVEINVMREWIRFGAVVLVVDYFLELTFFSTVLSIDIQRLELADLLAQNTSPVQSASAPSNSKSAGAESSAAWTFRSSLRGAWKVLRDRPAKTSTVAFLWFINLLLYAFYGSEHYLPAACSQTALSSDRPFLSPSLSPSISRSLRGGTAADPASSSPLDVPAGAASAFWRFLNPANATSVQLYLEPTVHIQFLDEEALAAPESLDLLHATPDGPSLFTKVMFVLLPIAIVMFLLYLLLLYLLKDAELLQAHWGSEERLGGPEARRKRREEANRKPGADVQLVKSLRARHEGDVELVASGGDVVVSWAGLEEKVLVQRRTVGSDTAASFDLNIPLGAEPISLTALSVDGDGRFCAAATSKGRVLIWCLERGGALVDFGGEPSPRSPVVSLLATPHEAAQKKVDELASGTPAPPSRIREEELTQPTAFWSLHRDGRVLRWDCRACQVAEAPVRSAVDEGQVTRRWLAGGVDPSGVPVLVVASNSGRVAISPLGRDGEPALLEPVGRAPGEQVVSVKPAEVPLAASVDGAPAQQKVGLVGTSSGGVHLSSLSPPTHLLLIAELGSPIRQIRLVDSPTSSYCPTCNELIVDGFTALVSTRTTLHVFRLFTPPTPSSLEPCTCNTSDTTIIARSRSSSTGLLSSPIMSRTLSSGGTARRFSPRKKTVTPTRPTQLPPSSLGDSPVRPRLHSRGANGSYGSHSSTSSSGAGSPVNERGPPHFTPLASPVPPPPLSSAPSSALSPATSDISPLPGSIALPPPAMADPLSASEAPSPFPHLRAVELASLSIDERSGWDVVDGRAVGLRRTRKSDSGGRGWEVWTLSLGKDGAAFEDGYDEGATELGELMSAADEEEDLLAGSISTGVAASSTLRRRLPAGSLYPPSTSVGAASPTVRFSAETVDLPFARARPLVPSLGGTGLSVGLGNQLVVLETLQRGGLNLRQNGFLGL
ncbi:hypothetical protein JCM10207_007376 [Rhodosporidiobolus poonsookiae]